MNKLCAALAARSVLTYLHAHKEEKERGCAYHHHHQKKKGPSLQEGGKLQLLPPPSTFTSSFPSVSSAHSNVQVCFGDKVLGFDQR